jgi:hypothetical protein
MQQHTRPAGRLSLCGSSIDARLEEPIPLRIGKDDHKREDMGIDSESSSRQTSSGGVAELLAGAGRLTIMKRRGRHNRPSLRSYMNTQGPSESAERASSSSTQFGNNLDGSLWTKRHDIDPAGLKSDSLIVPKVRQRPTSMTEVLKGAIRQERGPSSPLSGRFWRSNSPKMQNAVMSDDENYKRPSAHASSQMSTIMGQAVPERWNAYFVLSPCVTITPDVSALKEGQHTV